MYPTRLRMIWKETVFVLLFGLVFCSATPPGVDVPPGAKLALINGTLIDGTGAAAVRNAVLAIGMDGKIVAVGRRGDAPIPAETTVIDVEGATILPGFINAHVHDAYSVANLEAWAAAGVTTVRDEAINSQDVTLADLIARRNGEWN